MKQSTDINKGHDAKLIAKRNLMARLSNEDALKHCANPKGSFLILLSKDEIEVILQSLKTVDALSNKPAYLVKTDDTTELLICSACADTEKSEQQTFGIAARLLKERDALVNTLKYEISLIDQTINNIHSGQYHNQSATDIEVAVSRQKARLSKALSSYQALGGG